MLSAFEKATNKPTKKNPPNWACFAFKERPAYPWRTLQMPSRPLAKPVLVQTTTTLPSLASAAPA